MGSRNSRRGAVSIFALLMLFVAVLIPIWIVLAIARYFREMSEERRRLRLEVGKLAHEMESLRADLGRSADAAGKPSG
jgi:hypothetical protein